jgi:hypothetical protein
MHESVCHALLSNRWEIHNPLSQACLLGASVPPVQDGAVEVAGICGGIGVIENRFGPDESGRRTVALGDGDLGDGGCGERIDGGER